MEGARLSLQRVREGGTAELNPAQRHHVLGRSVVEQLVLPVFMHEPAQLPGLQRPPLLQQEPTQFGLACRRDQWAGLNLLAKPINGEGWSLRRWVQG